MKNYLSWRDREKRGPYKKIKEDQVKKLLEDRIEFKLWSAEQHLDKLLEIRDLYGGIMGIYRVYAESELDCYFAQIIGARDSLLMRINDKLELGLREWEVRLDSIEERLAARNRQYIIDELVKLARDEGSWYWALNRLRNRSIHVRMLNKLARRSIIENVNNGTSSSSAEDYLLKPPHYKTSIDQEIVSYLSTNLRNMRNLLISIVDKMG